MGQMIRLYRERPRHPSERQGIRRRRTPRRPRPSDPHSRCIQHRGYPQPRRRRRADRIPAVSRSSRRASERTGLPTCPSSGLSNSASTSPASNPLNPTGRAPAARKAETNSALTLPAKTLSTASMTSGVVTRNPFTKRLSTPRSARNRVICLPPPWTTTIRLSGSAAAWAISRARRRRDSGASSRVPPSLISSLRGFTFLGLKGARRFPDTPARGSCSGWPVRPRLCPDCRSRKQLRHAGWPVRI